MDNYIVYMHVTPNDKKYIGITCKRATQRWANGKGYTKNTAFNRAINKYGWKNIRHCIVAENISKDDACRLETELIRKNKTTDPEFGYNISSGGESGTCGVKFGPEFGQKVRERMIGEKNMNYGKKFSKETLKKLSDARKGKWSDKQKAALTKVHDSMKKRVVCLDTGTVYESITDATRQTGIPSKGIGEICKGTRISTHGTHWAYYTGQTKEELEKLLSDLLYKKEMVYKARKVWNAGLQYKTGKQKNPCLHRRNIHEVSNRS